MFVVFRPGDGASSVTRIARDGSALVDADDHRRTDGGTRPRVQGLGKDEEVQPPVDTPLPACEVTINGHKLPVRWSPPFHFDLTPHVAGGANTIEVAVTNAWHNRLAHDAALQPKQRKTWTINAPSPEAPRQEAGLLGPVILHHGKRIALAGAAPGTE